MFDRIAIAQAWFWWLNDHHEGQWTERYARLCKLGRSYKPGMIERGPNFEQSREIYNTLCDRENCTHERLPEGLL